MSQLRGGGGIDITLSWVVWRLKNEMAWMDLGQLAGDRSCRRSIPCSVCGVVGQKCGVLGPDI